MSPIADEIKDFEPHNSADRVSKKKPQLVFWLISWDDNCYHEIKQKELHDVHIRGRYMSSMVHERIKIILYYQFNFNQKFLNYKFVMPVIS